jgi:exonuclease III
MKIVTWNCGGAFRKKYTALLDINADVFIIQECEDPKRLVRPEKDFLDFSLNSLWNGDNKNKGIGVFVKKNISIEPFAVDNIWRERELKWFLPVILNKKQKLLGVWAHNADAEAFDYIGQFWNLLQMNRKNLKDSLIIGDFNSNTRWDHWDRWWNHSDCVRELEAMDIHSVYHHINNVEHGKENQPTFFLRKNAEKPYHIDYVFSPMNIIAKMTNLSFGSYQDWHELSDHVPVIWEYDE